MSVAFGTGGLWRSTDDGTTWVRAQTDPVNGYGALAIASDGTSLYAARGTGRMVRSTNSGVDWIAANDGLPASFNAYAVAAARSSVLCGGNFNGGVYRSTDAGASWTESSVGLAGRNMSVLRARGDTVFAGTTDGTVSRSFDGGQTSTDVTPDDYTGTNWVIAILMTDSTVVLGDAFSGSTPGILRSADWGTTWNPYMDGIDETTRGNAYGFAVIDTFQFTGMGSGSSTGGIYKRSISAPEWTPINSDQMIGGTPPVTGDTVYIYMTTMMASGTTLFAGFGGSGLYRSTDLGTTWEQITSDAGNPSEARPGLAENNGTLYAGGAAAGVFISTDNGGFWNEYTANIFSALGISSFTFIDPVIFAGQFGLGVKRSTDGGRLWFPVNSGLSNLDVRKLAATGNTLFAGTGGGVFVSSDLGDSWSPTTMTSPVNALRASGNTALASQTGAFYRSTDLGQTWTQVTMGVPSGWNAQDFAKVDNRWFAGGGAVKVLTSTDDGLSWTDISGTIPGPIYALATAGDTLYAATLALVYYTTDLGQTWTLISSDGYSFSIHALMVTGGYIYAGMTGSSAYGAYRRAVPGTTSVELIDEAVPHEFLLEQNYPNPFNPSTNIKFHLPASASSHGQAGITDLGLVSLVVFDVLGRQVATLVNETLAPGSYSTTFDASGLSSGMYFYRLSTTRNTQTRKLVLLK